MLARVGAWAVAVIAVLELVPRLPSTGQVELDAFLGFTLGLAPLLAVSWTMVRGRLPMIWLVVVLVSALGVSLLLSRVEWFSPAVPFKLMMATAAGILLGLQVAEVWWLALIAVFAILADTWSVFAGPTKVVVERAPGALDYLLVHFPMLGAEGPGMGLGVSDFVFLALFTAASIVAGLRPRAGFWAMAASLPVTVGVALAWKPALPALPFLALAFLAVNARSIARSIPRGRGVAG